MEMVGLLMSEIKKSRMVDISNSTGTEEFLVPVDFLYRYHCRPFFRGEQEYLCGGHGDVPTYHRRTLKTDGITNEYVI